MEAACTVTNWWPQDQCYLHLCSWSEVSGARCDKHRSSRAYDHRCPCRIVCRLSRDWRANGLAENCSSSVTEAWWIFLLFCVSLWSFLTLHLLIIGVRYQPRQNSGPDCQLIRRYQPMLDDVCNMFNVPRNLSDLRRHLLSDLHFNLQRLHEDHQAIWRRVRGAELFWSESCNHADKP